MRKTRYRLNQQGTLREARTHIFHYNRAGQLIQQTVYKPNGTLKRQKHYIWLEQMPIAFLETVYRNNGSIKREELAYITPDHLNTPRLATNDAQQITWTWRSDAFGVGKIEKDPDGDGIKTNIRLRFPGQYEDGESGLHYNYFRDYHPGWGRYVQSDPIGLNGGTNTYVYVGGNPVVYIDSKGEIGVPGAAIGGLIGGVSAFTGSLSTGASIRDALVSAAVGGVIGAGTGFFGGVGVGSATFLGGLSNFGSQVISNNINNDQCNNVNINWGSVFGSAIGGGWAAGITRGAGAISGAVIGWGPSTASGAIGTALGQ